jgi:hypothetical protein
MSYLEFDPYGHRCVFAALVLLGLCIAYLGAF